MSNKAKWRIERTLASYRPNVSPIGFFAEVYFLCRRDREYAIVSVSWGNCGEGISICPIDIQKDPPQDDIEWCRKYEEEFRNSAINEPIGAEEYSALMCSAGNVNELNRVRDGIKNRKKCVCCGTVAEDWYYYDNRTLCASCLNKAR